jgi:hypothetical protein
VWVSYHDGVQATVLRPVAIRAGMVAMGLVIGVGLSSFGLLWPWIVSLVVAGVGLALRQRYPLLLWLALGVVCGALTYLVLGLLIVGQPPSGSGGS